MHLTLEVVTIEREVYRADDVDMVIAPGSEGELGILPRHEPLITSLKEGVLQIVRGDQRDLLAIGGGFLEVHGTSVVVMADVAEEAHEIEVARAEEARRRAERVLAEAPTAQDGRAAAAALRRATVRLKVAHRRRAGRPGEGAGGGL